MGSIRNVFKVKKCDLVICVVPFTSSIVLGLLMRKLRGAKVWVHIQDFEFDAAVESGLAGEQTGLKAKVFKGLFWLERKLLAKADIVSTISYGMLSKLETKTSTPKYFFPNWVDENFIDPKTAVEHELMKSSKFKVLYSGNIGAKQDWAFFIEVVKYFNGNDHIEFIIVGAGAKKEWLVEQTKVYKNVKHYMPVEYATLPDLLCSANLHILFQKNNVIDTVMPSKLLGMMASAKPSLVTGSTESEVAKVFDKSKGVYFYDSECFTEVISAIKELSENQDKSNQMGIDARTYIVGHFSASKVLSNFEYKVQEIIDN
jgi:colanic acid biosynthesis glycosyl transferase WcaI